MTKDKDVKEKTVDVEETKPQEKTPELKEEAKEPKETIAVPKETVEENLDPTVAPKEVIEEIVPEFVKQKQIDMVVYSVLYSIISALPTFEMNKQEFSDVVINETVKRYSLELNVSELVSPVIEKRVKLFLVNEMLIIPNANSAVYTIQPNVGNSTLIRMMFTTAYLLNVSLVVGLQIYQVLDIKRLGEFFDYCLEFLPREFNKTVNVIDIIDGIDIDKDVDESIKKSAKIFFESMYLLAGKSDIRIDYLLANFYTVEMFLLNKMNLT